MNRYHVLIIEDEQPVAEITKTILEALPPQLMDCSIADRLSTAKAKINEKPDIEGIILDLTLPNGSGASTVKKCREFAPKQALVVVTGIDDVYRDEVMLAGADGFFTKPLNGLEVGRALFKAIEDRRIEAALAD